MAKINSKDWVTRYKASEPCADCKHTFPPECMDFDHVMGKKTENVAAMVQRGASNLLILEEINKCDLVCSNCHRTRTKNRRVTKAKPVPSRPWGRRKKKTTRQVSAQRLFEEILNADSETTLGEVYDSIALTLGVSRRTVKRYLL